MLLLSADFRTAIERGTGTIELPAGITHLDHPLQIPRGSKGVTILGHKAGSVLILDAAFKGSAALIADGISGLTLADFEIRGNRTVLKSPWYFPLKEAAFADFYPDNGIVIRNSDHVVVRDIRFTQIKTFPLIFNASSAVTVSGVHIEDSGTLNAAGRNNTSGGILLEEGVNHFDISHCAIERITGNAIWTHSYARSPRAADGSIHHNTIATVGRDAVQVGHASRIRVEHNSGSKLGFPPPYVDVETHGVAVALDTAGNVDRSIYSDNHFTDVNGQCIDLDGFHDGQITGNSCVNTKPLESYPALHYGIVFGNNNPGMDSTGVTISGNTIAGFAYGAVFLIGSHNRIENNRFLNINLAHCGATPVTARCNYALDQPDLLRAGIYLSDNGGRPTVTRDNIIRSNVIEGFGMNEHCIASARAVQFSSNIISGNTCRSAPIGNRPGASRN